MSPANKAIECATVGRIADNNISGEGTANNTQKSFNSIILPHRANSNHTAHRRVELSLMRIVRTVFVQIERQTDIQTERRTGGKTEGQRFAEL